MRERSDSSNEGGHYASSKEDLSKEEDDSEEEDHGVEGQEEGAGTQEDHGSKEEEVTLPNHDWFTGLEKARVFSFSHRHEPSGSGKGPLGNSQRAFSVRARVSTASIPVGGCTGPAAPAR